MDPVLRYIARWGVPVISSGQAVSTHRRATHGAPYGYIGGIHWPTRTIITQLRSPTKWEGCLLVHELSHVLVEHDPNTVDEVQSAMLALDYAGCRLLKLAWSSWMSEFVVNDSHWSLMSLYDRQIALGYSRSRAIDQGLLDARGRPTYRRLPRKDPP